jgi:hypothetical protein
VGTHREHYEYQIAIDRGFNREYEHAYSLTPLGWIYAHHSARVGRLSQGKLYKRLDHPENKRFTKVRLYGSADLRLGGTYLLKVELSRKEIAELFFETHKAAMVRMIQSFIEDEENEDRARLLAEIAQRAERRRQRLAQEEQTESQGS